jgi:hypothetical protein
LSHRADRSKLCHHVPTSTSRLPTVELSTKWRKKARSPEQKTFDKSVTLDESFDTLDESVKIGVCQIKYVTGLKKNSQSCIKSHFHLKSFVLEIGLMSTPSDASWQPHAGVM